MNVNSIPVRKLEVYLAETEFLSKCTGHSSSYRCETFSTNWFLFKISSE